MKLDHNKYLNFHLGFDNPHGNDANNGFGMELNSQNNFNGMTNTSTNNMMMGAQTNPMQTSSVNSMAMPNDQRGN